MDIICPPLFAVGATGSLKSLLLSQVKRAKKAPAMERYYSLSDCAFYLAKIHEDARAIEALNEITAALPRLKDYSLENALRGISRVALLLGDSRKANYYLGICLNYLLSNREELRRHGLYDFIEELGLLKSPQEATGLLVRIENSLSNRSVDEKGAMFCALADVYGKAKNPAKAAELLEKARVLAPQIVAPLGKALAILSIFDIAPKALEKEQVYALLNRNFEQGAISLEHPSADYSIWLGAIYARYNDMPKAVEALGVAQEALKRLPADELRNATHQRELLANIYLKANQPEMARTILKEAESQLNTEGYKEWRVPHWILLAKCYARLKDSEKARGILEGLWKEMRKISKEWMAHKEILETALELPNPDDRAAVYKAVLAGVPSGTSIVQRDLYFAVAKGYYRMKEYAKASEALDRAPLLREKRLDSETVMTHASVGNLSKAYLLSKREKDPLDRAILLRGILEAWNRRDEPPFRQKYERLMEYLD